jgi:hypothetical protein
VWERRQKRQSAGITISRMDTTLLTVAWTFIAAGAGAYLGAYLKKKGENLATHEDLENLLAQVSAVTTTTKEIESKISNETWDRQRRWETKKAALFGVVAALGTLRSALAMLIAAHQVELENEEASKQKRLEVMQDYTRAMDAYSASGSIALITCELATRAKMSEIQNVVGNVASEAVRGDADAASAAAAANVARLSNELIALVQKELRLDTEEPQSSSY